MNEKRLNLEILKAVGTKPWVTFPHALAMKLSRGLWKPYAYLVRVSRILVTVIVKKNGRVILNAPCRHGKTSLTMYLIIFFLELYPEKTVLFCTYSESFAIERVRLIRNEIRENRHLLNIRLAKDAQKLEGGFHTQQGGGVIPASIGGGLAGLAGDCILIDDVHKNWEQSQNPNERHKVVSWFQGTCYTRLQPGGTILCASARWHESDLTGFLLNHHPDRWLHLCFPALSKGPKVDPLKRPEGEPLIPELYNRKDLERTREAVGDEVWQSQYQQAPIKQTDNGAHVVFADHMISQIGESPLPPFQEMKPNTRKAIRFISLDVGKKKSHSAITVCERTGDDPESYQMHLISLKRFELETKIRRVIETVDELSRDPRFGLIAPHVLLDKSGLQGDLILELLNEKDVVPVIPLTILPRGNPKSRYSVLKSDLVDNFLEMMEDRFFIAKGLPNIDLLYDELRGYRSRKSPKGMTTAFRPHSVGTDDLLDTILLTAWVISKGWVRPFTREFVGLSEGSARRRPISGNRGDYAYNLKSSSYAQFSED